MQKKSTVTNKMAVYLVLSSIQFSQTDITPVSAECC